MNISAPSLSFVSRYAKAPPPATSGRVPAPVLKEADSSADCGGSHSTTRTNRLTQALTAALRQIGIGDAPATTDTTATPGTAATSAAGDTTATPPASGDLNAAVEQFASALMDALGAGRGARGHGHGGEHHQDGEQGHHGHGGREKRYGDLAQRLESLSKTVFQAAPSTQIPLAPTTPVAPVTDAPISLAPKVDSDMTAAPAPAPATPAAPAATRAALSPLLDAFTKLFNALKPPATADAPATDMASRLQQFLHTMAQTLSHNGLDGAAAPQSGAFIDVKA